jgi:hypothetical protein
MSELHLPDTPTRRSKVRMKKKHRTPAQIARSLVAIVARWAPNRRFHLICDKVFASHELADSMNPKGKIPGLRNVSMVSHLQMDASLYSPPPPYRGKGRKRVKGDKLPGPGLVASMPRVRWTTIEVAWYGGKRKVVKFISRNGLWYRCGYMATWVRWVLVRDPDGKREDRVIFTTDPGLSARDIIELFVVRWSLEVTFEETKRHLGVESLRNRSTKSVSRSVPFLLSLYSFIVLWYHLCGPDVDPGFSSSPWYKKTHLTFSDLLDLARNDVLMEILFIQVGSKPCEFLNAPFPLNLLYSYISQNRRAA